MIAEDDFLKVKDGIFGKNKKHPHLRTIPIEHSFKLKKNSSETITEISSLEDLMKAIERVPEEAIVFHMRNGRNDFATWIEKIFENKFLSKKLNEITLKEENLEETRWRLVGVLYTEILSLKLSQLYSNDLR